MYQASYQTLPFNIKGFDKKSLLKLMITPESSTLRKFIHSSSSITLGSYSTWKSSLNCSNTATDSVQLFYIEGNIIFTISYVFFLCVHFPFIYNLYMKFSGTNNLAHARAKYTRPPFPQEKWPGIEALMLFSWKSATWVEIIHWFFHVIQKLREVK